VRADPPAVVIRDARHDDAAELARLCTLLGDPMDGAQMVRPRAPSIGM
jgi:hypothetical protein